MRVVYLPSAQDDLVWFYEYYTSVFSDGASRALKQFDKMAELLSINPYIGKRSEGKTRELVIPNTPFSYIYRVSDTRIEIIRVWDNRQSSLD